MEAFKAIASAVLAMGLLVFVLAFLIGVLPRLFPYNVTVSIKEHDEEGEE